MAARRQDRGDVAGVVRREVRRLLEAMPAYRGLPAEKQRELGEGMIRIGAYLAEPEGIRADRLAGAITTIPAQAGGRTGLAAAVDFPEFVAGLIQGVFQSIVDASIQQMEAYGDLVKSVAQTVDEFAASGISDGGLRPGVDCAEALPRPLRKLGPEEIEKKLVPAARRRLAAGRQRLLASMVMMGINRIVVTDGRINA